MRRHAAPTWPRSRKRTMTIMVRFFISSNILQLEPHHKIFPQINVICYRISMPTINPHINFNGNAEEAFAFYKSVFGGEFAKIIRFKDLAIPEFRVSEKEENKIMH